MSTPNDLGNDYICTVVIVPSLCAGAIRIYDTADFSLVAEFSPAGTDVPSMVNDVIVTKTAAFFTDSFQAQLYSVRISDSGL